MTREQLLFKNNKMLLELRDCAINVAAKNNLLAISKMFSTELKFTSDFLLGWFNKKYKSTNLELSSEVKKQYETKNPIIWKKDKCSICTFPLEINARSFHSKGTDKMSYSNFYIVKEHKFLRNIFLKEGLNKTKNLKNIELFHESLLNF